MVAAMSLARDGLALGCFSVQCRRWGEEKCKARGAALLRRERHTSLEPFVVPVTDH